MQIAPAMVQKAWAVSYEIKDMLSVWSAIPLLGVYCREIKVYFQTKLIHSGSVNKQQKHKQQLIFFKR